ncbi:hypothetical protein ATKI12_1251 [Kitasatospora sp. Ki12]|uniref:hypothetical protein n=1 Tax=Kitasatospora xanthocidica TaxID=83382 RepID=UPI001672C54A|nr:hypothetical protein [Kitasatospora xanthocidica]
MTASDALRTHGPGTLPDAARPCALTGAVDRPRRCRAMSCTAPSCTLLSRTDLSCTAAARP